MRRASLATILGVVVAVAISLAITWGWLFSWPGRVDVFRATHGLVQSTLIASLVDVVLIGVVLRTWSPADLGLRTRDLRGGILTLVVGYAGIEVGLVVAALVAGDGVHAAPLDPVGVVAGTAIAQIFGNVLIEEIVFRGFLLRQFVARLGVVKGASLAALVFALTHIPQRMSLGLGGLDLVGELAAVWCGGMFAAYLYLRGRNLMVVMALHVLFNDQIALVATPFPAQWLVLVPFVGTVVWIEIAARRGRLAPDVVQATPSSP